MGLKIKEFWIILTHVEVKLCPISSDFLTPTERRF